MFGGIALSGGLCGVLVGGWVADRLHARMRAGRTLTIALGFACAVPFACGAVLLDRGALFFVSSWLLMFFLPWYNGPIAAVVNNLVRDEDATKAQAMLAFLMHLLGTAPGGWVVGMVSDATGSLRWALMLPTVAVLLGVDLLLHLLHLRRRRISGSGRSNGNDSSWPNTISFGPDPVPAPTGLTVSAVRCDDRQDAADAKKRDQGPDRRA